MPPRVIRASCMSRSGFVLEDNASDLLMVRCPLPPPGDWDETLTGRALLLRRRGLSPQLFLPAAPLRAPPELRVSAWALQ